ncbi:MAG: diguanylate cyclase [Nitrospirota bacterium]
MGTEVVILIIEAMVVYFMVLAAHSLRHRFGPVHFYALIGGITAIMSWVTDAGLKVHVSGITFVVGSTVFYTSLLLGVFVVYVFDGPRATRIAISTVVGVSIMVPLVAVALHFQAALIGYNSVAHVPVPSLRINAASVIATLLDLVFLAIVWEVFGKPFLKIQLWLRAFLTLLGVMWLDVILFATGAFAGTPEYFSIMQGTLVSRLIVSVFALPFLYGYLHWQSDKKGLPIENRPVLSILKKVAEIEIELSLAKQEIEQRKQMEVELRSLSITDELTGLYNRRGFGALAEHQLKIANRLGQGHFLLYADLDGLKNINDTLGHKEGDKILIRAADILTATYRNSDIIARMGGDEFVVFPIGTAGDNVEMIISRLQNNIDLHNSGVSPAYKISMSIGVAYYDPESPCTVDELLTRADNAMYENKKVRRSRGN